MSINVENQRPKQYLRKPEIVSAYQVHLPTLIEAELDMLEAQTGDWIITDAKGRPAICKDSAFVEKYELVTKREAH